jgi:glucose/arabinose dehydrogenase
MTLYAIKIIFYRVTVMMRVNQIFFRKEKKFSVLLFKISLIFWIFFITSAPSLAKNLPIERLKLPPHFSISVYANNIKDARGLTIGNEGTVFVGSNTAGNVYAILPNRSHPASDERTVKIIASGLNQPHGVAFHKGALYVATVDQILRYDDIEKHLDDPPVAKIVTDDFPTSLPGAPKEYFTRHSMKTIRFSPDGKLYIAIGAPCDACLSQDPRLATIMRMNIDGSEMEIYAKGIRNSVGFDWDPLTHELWFTDNGRDRMGDNMPPDKLDYAPTKGLDFGFPYYHAKDANGNPIPDPKYGKQRSPGGITWPALALPAHVAALGMTFYTGKMFPAIYQNQIIIAEHGSWNRSKKVGYRLTLVKLDKNRRPISYEAFITGWEENEKVWGRPVAIDMMPDGSLLVSDDHAGAVYRITYSKT